MVHAMKWMISHEFSLALLKKESAIHCPINPTAPPDARIGRAPDLRTKVPIACDQGLFDSG